MTPTLAWPQQDPHGDIEVDEIVFQERCGMLDAELFLQ
jgi:hypothetical protein